MAATNIQAWISWARRSRPRPVKGLAATLCRPFNAVVCGAPGNRSHTFIKAMNRFTLQAKHATPLKHWLINQALSA